MDEIRIGLVGLGYRGLGWLRILKEMPGYRVTALCDRIPALHERALAALGARVPTYARYEEVLADANVDAIALCVRCPDHGALAAQGLEAGKPVHSEVPAAYTIEDCWRIVLAAERTGVFYHLAEQTRFWGFVEGWKSLVRAGELGDVTYCEGEYLGYYGTAHFNQDPQSGRFYGVDELAAHPEARPTWFQLMQPIHYLPHELGPMLKVLGDRVVEVTAMSTPSPSRAHPEIAQADIQVALMRTAKGALLRMVVGFTQPLPHHGHHWYRVIGTRGCVEWKRSERDQPKLWLAGVQMHGAAEVDWRYERTDAPAEARASGHNDADYYVHAAFRDALLYGRATEWDVYHAVETAAPAALAADSIAQGTVLLKVPDFRPNAARAAGQAPAGLAL